MLAPAAPWLRHAPGRCCYRDVSYFAVPFCEVFPFTYVTYPLEEPLLVKAVNVLAAAHGCMWLLEDPHGPCSPAAPEVCTATGRWHQQPLCPPSSKHSFLGPSARLSLWSHHLFPPSLPFPFLPPPTLPMPLSGVFQGGKTRLKHPQGSRQLKGWGRAGWWRTQQGQAQQGTSRDTRSVVGV